VIQTPAAASSVPAVPVAAGESFLAIVWRRTRYAVAIALSAVLFSYLGWGFARPPAEWGGVSLLVWPNHGILSTIVLMLLLLLVTAISSLIVHPDSPHMGLFCSLLGMAALSIRGGTVHMLMVYAQDTDSTPRVAVSLALECLEWGCVILLADAFARWLHDRFLANQRWVFRVNPSMGRQSDLAAAAGFAKYISHHLHTDRIKGPVRIPLAMICSGALAFLFLIVFMQSELKGQVLMACFVSFFLSTLCAYAAFPTVPFWSLILAVPLTGAVGYLISRNYVPTFPGHAPDHSPGLVMRALPIDYLTVGVPGAILGLYWGLAWALGTEEEP
jgi:hypothetical protein